jgi:hypothetical protein
MVIKTSGGATPSDTGSGLGTTQPQVLLGTATWDGTNSNIETFVDGSTNGATAFGSSMNTATSPISLFDTPGQGVQFSGDFYIALVIAGALSSGDRTNLVTYLGNKCGRTL